MESWTQLAASALPSSPVPSTRLPSSPVPSTRLPSSPLPSSSHPHAALGQQQVEQGMNSEDSQGEPPNQTGDLLDQWQHLNSQDHYALGHQPRIARRIAHTVYGIHPEAWSRRARLLHVL